MQTSGLRGAVLGLAGMLLCGVAHAADADRTEVALYDLDRAVFGFAGVLTRDSMGDTANPFTTDYEDNAVFGLGYQQLVYDAPWRFDLGWEAGIAARVGERASGELWGGLLIRHRGISLFDTIRVVPSITGGLSVVTHPIGSERVREQTHDGDATLLFYLGPEISLSLEARPEYEAFWRLHHRSGAGQTLGSLHEGANANVVGLRRRF